MYLSEQAIKDILMKKLTFIIVIIFAIACHHGRKESHLPFFNLLLPDSTTRFNTAMIPEGKTTILLYFSPDCEHCQHETEGILHAMDSLKEIRFYFITTDSLNRMTVFYNFYQLYRYPNITVGQDYTSSFRRRFNSPAQHYLVIYDQHKRQKGVFEGATSVSQIIEFVNKL